ncbi:hypothetical protein V498_10304, partial [Pseudogymnoascus sp. VKM F-4517 (FW-2822)]
TLSESSPLERAFIHGNNSASSCRETVDVLAFHNTWLEKGVLLRDEQNTVHALELAIAAGDLVVVEAILDACQQLEDDEFQDILQLGRIAILRTALQTACRDIYDREVSLSLISFALSHGSDVNATAGMYQDSPLIFITIEHQREELFRFLFDRGADLAAKDNQGRCSVHLFAIHGFFKSFPLEKIEELGISFDVVDSQGRTPLHYAAKSGALKQTQLLLEHGANANQPDFAGHRAIHHAVVSKTARIVEAVILFQERSHINSCDHASLMTPLAIAAKDGMQDIVKLLLDSGADTFQGNKDDKLPIHHAAEHRRTAVIEEILKNRPEQQIVALLAARTKSKHSPLDLSIAGLRRKGDDRAACDMLLTAGADATQSLVSATKNDYTWMVKYLLRYNPDLEYHDKLDAKDASSALTAATVRENVDIVELLLKNEF